MITSFRRLGTTIVLSTVALFSLASCGVSPRHTISSSSAESEISAHIKKTYGVPSRVDCPTNIPDQTGSSFTCRALIYGQVVVMSARVTGSGSFSVSPNSAIVVVASFEADLTERIAAATFSTPRVDCGSVPVLVEAVGDSFDCQATFSGQEPRQVKVTVADLKGTFRYTLSGTGPTSG